MVRIVTDYLDNTARLYPEKVAFVDENRAITFRELQEEAHHIATQIIDLKIWKNPILVYLDKSVEVIAAFAGITYSGNFYCPLDTAMPRERIEKIIEKLQPTAIITNERNRSAVMEFKLGVQVFLYEEMLLSEIDIAKIRETTDKVIDSDTLYVLFTSGSTGIPKGGVISHRGLIDLTEWIADELCFNHDSIMANQSPFYFSFSVYEIYQTLRNGATTYIIPSRLFTQPGKLMKYLDEHKVNTLIWVPSILTFLSNVNAVTKLHLDAMKYIYFGAETFQIKHLNRWMKEYPQVRFFNLYGPTEVTDTCTYYEVKQILSEDEMMPIGKSCKNKECFLLDGDCLVTEAGKIGEICVRGSGIAYGYYNDIERTKEVFVQNPLNSAYEEKIYRTGDLAKYNDEGDLIYVCRKDYQIKHQGRRIELGEIEAAVATIEEVEDNCCLYDNSRLRIVLFYVGDIEGKDVAEKLKQILPNYMIPTKNISLKEMPHNINGKIDRQKLKQMMGD